MDSVAPLKLTGLAALLRQRPPSLADMVALLYYLGDYKWFGELVEEYLPDEVETLAAIPNLNSRVERFSSIFSQRYFPIYTDEAVIDWGNEEPAYRQLHHCVPFELFGIGYDEKHFLWTHYQPGFAAMALLSAPVKEHLPYYQSDLEGLRLAWFESAAQYIPAETLRRIPANGIETGVLERVTEGTRFAAMGPHARWLWNSTDNFFLDFSYSDGVEFDDPWDRDVVENATRIWREASGLIDQVEALGSWLEQDMPVRFADMLDYILSRIKEERNE